MYQSVCRWGLCWFWVSSLVWLAGCSNPSEEPENTPKAVPKAEQQKQFLWKFDKDKTYHWVTTTSVSITAPQGDKEVTGKAGTTIDFDIQVLEQDPSKENSLLKLSVVRIRSTSTLPEMKFDYDSAKKVDEAESEKSFAAEMMAAFAADLLQTEIECQVDSHGVIKVVQYDQELKQQIQMMPGSESTAALFETKGLNSIFYGGIIPIPESVVKIGDHWNQSYAYLARGLGDMTLSFSPQYKGEVKIKEKILEQFDIPIDVKLESLLPPTMVKLGEQSSSGVFYFDPQANIVRQCEWKVNIELILDRSSIVPEAKEVAKGRFVYEGRSRFGFQSEFSEDD